VTNGTADVAVVDVDVEADDNDASVDEDVEEEDGTAVAATTCCDEEPFLVCSWVIGDANKYLRSDEWSNLRSSNVHAILTPFYYFIG
jgi:hypothetical protein